MKDYFQKVQGSRGISVTIYTIGLSRDHDASLLNDLAQAGSQTGNFIYIDTSKDDYSDDIVNSLVGSINAAVSNMSSSRISIQNGESTQLEMVNLLNNEDDKIMQYTTQIFMNIGDLNDKLRLHLLLKDDKKIECQVSINKKEVLSEEESQQAEIKYINREVFKLIQMMQD